MMNGKIIALLVFFVCTNRIAYSQITFVDVNPDSCICVSSVPSVTKTVVSNWDLNNDAVVDFVIESSINYSDCTHGVGSTKITAMGSNSIAGDMPLLGINSAFMLNLNDTINTQTSWISGGWLRYFNYFSGFQGTYWAQSSGTMRYAGVKFYSGTNLYYGWIGMNVSVASCGSANVVLKEFAYSPTLIKAGEGSTTSISENNLSQKTKIYPNPNNGLFEIEVYSSDEQLLRIFDLAGKLVFTKNILNDSKIDISFLKNGVYSLTLSSEKGMMHKKLTIVH